MVARFFLHQKGGKYTKFTSQSDCTITTNPAVIVRYFFFYLLVKTITLYPRGIQFYNCNPILQLQSNFTIAIQFYNCNPILQLQSNFTIAIQFYNCNPILQLLSNVTITYNPFSRCNPILQIILLHTYFK
jgi:hypothetical protein